MSPPPRPPRTRFAPYPYHSVPIVGTIGAGGVVTLFDTPAARRLAGLKTEPPTTAR